MGKFLLCDFCLSRFRGGRAVVSRAPPGADCFICTGMCAKIAPMAKSAVLQSGQFEWGTFSVSSSFPRSVFVREETVADFFAPGGFSSLKNAANALAVSEISSATGKKNTQRFPDAVFEFNFISGSSAARPTPVYIFGHYTKLSRKHCQSRWHCSECGGRGCNSCGGSGQNYPSIEEEIGKVLQPIFGASSVTLHASGREDVDVRTFGNGRPFVMELKGPKKRNAGLAAAEKTLSGNDAVRASGLQSVLPIMVDAVCNSHFEKEYSALVSADRPLTKEDAQKAESLSGAMIFQQTPVRVLGRRSDLERKRKVYRIGAQPEKGGKLRVKILAEAGTYIKELIHGDEGRTKPNLSLLLDCRAACDELDVIGIHDYFLETVARQ